MIPCVLNNCFGLAGVAVSVNDKYELYILFISLDSDWYRVQVWFSFNRGLHNSVARMLSWERSWYASWSLGRRCHSV